MSGQPRVVPPERDIIIEDPSMAAGFTMIPNQLLRRAGLTPGAKLTYVMLMSYAWQDDACFPGQETLARDVGVTDRSIRTYMRELEAAKLVTVTQRGLNRTNLYVLHRIPILGPENTSGPERNPPAGPEDISGQDRKESSDQDRKILPTTKTQSDNTQKTMEGLPLNEDPPRRPARAIAPPAEAPPLLPETFTIAEVGLSNRQVWAAALAELAQGGDVSKADLQTWLHPASLVDREGDTLILAAPHAVARDRIAARHLPAVRAALSAIIGAPLSVEIVAR